MEGAFLGIGDWIVDGAIAVDGDGAQVQDGRGAEQNIGGSEQLADGDTKEPLTICN